MAVERSGGRNPPYHPSISRRQGLLTVFKLAAEPVCLGNQIWKCDLRFLPAPINSKYPWQCYQHLIKLNFIFPVTLGGQASSVAIPTLSHRNSLGTLAGKNNNHLAFFRVGGWRVVAAVAANKPKIFVFSRPLVDLLIWSATALIGMNYVLRDKCFRIEVVQDKSLVFNKVYIP